MSASQRRKGKAGELEVAKILAESLGIEVKRNLDQARDGKHDLSLPRRPRGKFRIEVKRRRGIQVATFLKQAEDACEPGDVALVLMRADGGEWMALMSLDRFLPMLAGELECSSPP